MDQPSEDQSFNEAPPVVPEDSAIDFGEPRLARSGPRRGQAMLAWIVIFLMVIVMAVLRNLGGEEAANGNTDDSMGITLMTMQAKYIVGAAQLSGEGDATYAQTKESINVGSVGQRQRFVILAAELVGLDEASQVLAQLDELIKAERSKDGDFELSESQVAIQEILGRLYFTMDETAEDEQTTFVARIDALSDDDRQLLLDELSWFGELALLPTGTMDTAARDAMLQPTQQVLVSLVGAVFFFSIAGIGGFIGLIVMLVLMLSGRVRSRLGSGTGHHGIYAETFAVWIVVFFLLQIPAAMLGAHMPTLSVGIVVGVFFISLLCLYWPVMRGLSWEEVRRDVGWTLGRNAALEPIIGVGGYFMALPLVGVGLLLTFLLLLIQGGLAGAGEPFAPTGGPAHPVVLEIATGGWLPRIQVLILAAVAAPIVEETMFRGVLYRHLRDASAGIGLPLSVILSGTINAFLFAAIHPQGWVAIPALMSLAYAFVLLREWRGTIIPSMIVHGISNGIIMSLLILLLSSSA